ncbi:uncharacterized protein ARMOST_18423 [Armillaria ostoyae]|uniref:Uncharacterized protein n=1 Tax=Armillaria ostoyae TaxID=47428 RepID=A0A284S1U2_ARMOS|nr:uncharacterized protein ARMOST_18423 [Armillaria ostoyae]
MNTFLPKIVPKNSMEMDRTFRFQSRTSADSVACHPGRPLFSDMGLEDKDGYGRFPCLGAVGRELDESLSEDEEKAAWTRTAEDNYS